MGLIGKLLSALGMGGSSTATDTSRTTPPDADEGSDPGDTQGDEGEAPEAAAEDEAAEEADEEEGGGDVPTKDVAAMADPRRREGEDNTVHNRAENPADHAAEAEDEAADDEEADEEEGDDVPTKDVAAMADPRRREGEENTVRNRAENPDDQRAT